MSHGGVEHNASRSEPLRRARRITLLSLAVLGVAGAAFVVRRPLMMSAPRCMAGQWHGCFDTFNGVVLLTLVGLPPAALVVWALARRRLAADVTSAWRMSLVLLNAAGAVLAALASRRWWRTGPEPLSDQPDPAPPTTMV